MTTTWTCWREPEHTVATHPEFGWPQCIDCGAAPPYHERSAFLDERLELTLVVPADNDSFLRRTVVKGAGIVSKPATGEQVIVYYEGWIHGPGQYGDRDARGLWEAGVEHAASRMVTQYPTAAMLGPRVEDVVPVGIYRPHDNSFTITNEEALNAWLSET